MKKTYTHKKSKKQRDSTQKTPPKTSVTQRLRTYLGQSVGVITTTPLVVKPDNERSTVPLTTTAM